MLSSLRIGSRRSDLARLQAQMIGKAIGSNQFVFREAPGDTNLKDPLWKMPEMGIFTSFLRKYLVSKEIDLVVHSWKDLPIEEDELTQIVAAPERADPRDLLLVSKQGLEKAYMTGELTVLSSSPRRRHNLPDFLLKSIPTSPSGASLSRVSFHDVRGNIQTRLQKMIDGEGHALIVAKAAIDRFLAAEEEEFQPAAQHIRDCLRQSKWQVLPLSVNPTAAAQGALAVEMLRGSGNQNILRERINHPSTFACVSEERRILHGLGGGCHQAIGCTVLDRPFGRVTFLRGVTDKQGEVTEARIENDGVIGIRKADSVDQVIQIGGKGGLQLFDRAEVEEDDLVKGVKKVKASHAVFASKSDAVHGEISDVLREASVPVWTSGVASWKVLAQQGIWVNGTCDGLGETEEKRVNYLMGNTHIEWTKLTHTGAVTDPNTEIGTYTLTLKPEWTQKIFAEKINNKSHFFFSSGSGFDAVCGLVPDFVSRVNSGQLVIGCGPGNTLAGIRKSVTAPIVVAYSFQEFLNKVIRAE